MSELVVRQRFEMTSADDKELERRIETLREAIRAQHGAILSIEWKARAGPAAHVASVLYELRLRSSVAVPRRDGARHGTSMSRWKATS